MQSFPNALVAALAAGCAVGLFAFAGVRLFRQGWAGYEERYVAGAERTLEAMYLTIPAQHLLYLALLSSALSGGVGYLLFRSLLLAVPFALAGLGLPTLVLSLLKRGRDRRFLTQLVDALMNISNSLKAGLSLPQALENLARESPPPMRQEMRLLCRELRLGVGLQEALEHLWERMPSREIELVVSAVGIVQDVGGNLTEVFDNIAHTLRERFRIEGKIRALTAMGRAQAVVISALPIFMVGALFFFLPGWINALFSTLGGVSILLFAAGLIGIGILLIRRMIAIDI
ncbi:MAG: type II secretion system F family protein [Planctomycetota bacterium]